MFNALPHPVDFQLAQSCLEGDDAALERFQQTYRPTVTAYLIGAGASPEEARDVTESLWSDCVAGSGERAAKLSRYNGNCALQTWLNTVALNDLLTRKRREQRWSRLIPVPAFAAGSDDLENRDEVWPADETGGEIADAPLLNIMRDAVEAAFLSCPAEDFVLLQLAHIHGVYVEELGRMLGRSKATISRHLEDARHGIEQATIKHIRRADPWLDLKWEDFVELCQTASPSCFGME